MTNNKIDNKIIQKTSMYVARRIYEMGMTCEKSQELVEANKIAAIYFNSNISLYEDQVIYESAKYNSENEEEVENSLINKCKKGYAVVTIDEPIEFSRIMGLDTIARIYSYAFSLSPIWLFNGEDADEHYVKKLDTGDVYSMLDPAFYPLLDFIFSK